MLEIYQTETKSIIQKRLEGISESILNIFLLIISAKNYCHKICKLDIDKFNTS